MMTRAEIAELLALISCHDYRTVGEADVEAWWSVASLEGWTLPAAQRAVAEFHRAQADRGRIRPAHVSDILREVRQQCRVAILDRPPVPPIELADNPRAEIEWRRAATRQAVEYAMAVWAQGEEIIPAPRSAAEPLRPPPAEIAELIRDTFAVPMPRHAAEDYDPEERRAQAQAELEALRQRAAQDGD